MKTIKSYMLGLSAMLAAIVGLTACQDDFDDQSAEAPVATLIPNTSILELKTLLWDDATNYIDTIWTVEWYEFLAENPDLSGYTKEQLDAKRREGSHIVISGRVISSDEAGNVFKSLVIQDETAALAMSINSYNLYLNYRVGQEIVIDATGMYIGKYNGLQQLGAPEWYANGNAWEATFMAPEFFKSHAELNGWPEPEKVDTIEVNSFSELSTNPDGLREWQSQIVKFNNVTFANGGSQTFSEYHSSGVNQAIVDKNGSSMNVRTSGYSTFWNKTLPSGAGDVVAICSYYGTSGWQLILIDYEGCMNFGNPTLPPGGKDDPYTVAQAIEAINNGETPTGWVSGYIVGTVAPEVTSVTSDNDIDWGVDPTLNNTLVIGEAADTRDIARCIVVALPAGSDLQRYGAIRENPSNVGRAIKIQGTLGTYLDTFGLLGNSGTADEFEIDGVTVGGGTSTGGVGALNETFESGEIPSDWFNVQLAGTKDWYCTSFSGNYYAAMTGYKGTAPFDSWLITPAIDMTKVADKVLTFESQVNGYGSTTTVFEVYVLTSADPATATKTKLSPTLPTAPASGYSAFTGSGNIDLSGFTGTIHVGFRYYATSDANYATWCVDNVTVGTAGTENPDTPDPDTPGNPVDASSADFDTMNGGTPVSTYGTYSSAQGWTAQWAQILAGSSSPDNKTTFEIFGSSYAVCLNGNTSKQGSLTSPQLSGGIAGLSFDYCQPYTDTKAKLTINIRQDGNVVASDVLEHNNMTKLTTYSYSHDFNVSGNFSIEIINECPSAVDSNKDRVAIYNLSWTK